jgi:hypothetical protein
VLNSAHVAHGAAHPPVVQLEKAGIDTNWGGINLADFAK